jgi:hypothetical protein
VKSSISRSVRAVRDVLEGVLDGRWSMASAKHWLEEHVPGDDAADEDPATALARRALRIAGCMIVVEKSRRADGCLDITADLLDPGRVNLF